MLLDPVPRACITAVRRAVAMNRLTDLQRLGLWQVLADGWLPTSFSGGLLLRRDFEVLETRDAADDEDQPTVPLVAHPEASPGAPAETP
jgi:hypothetical protein